MARTSFLLAGVEFKNRVLTASGTFGYGDECLSVADVSRFGGIVTKSLSLKPRPGNPPPRIVETPSGMLNSIGLANIGVHRFIREKLPVVRTIGTTIVANIAASSPEEYAAVLDLLDAESGISAFEINLSCPNVKEGGLIFGTRPDAVASITRLLRARTRKPLIIKLTPNVTHIGEFARAVEAEGADAISVINTVIGMAVDINTRRPVLSTVTGGLSGPAIKPIALAKVYETVRAVKIPVIGIGGITTAADAIEFLLVGATAVQVGTSSFVTPNAAADVADGIALFCDERAIADVAELVGSMEARTGVSVLDSWL
jgi:dihydroorotate dehydrogenase (NAD+) catalytic subunit